MRTKTFNRIVDQVISKWGEGSYKKARRRLVKYVVSNTTSTDVGEILNVVKLKWDARMELAQLIIKQIMDKVGRDHRDLTRLKEVSLKGIVGLHPDSHFVFEQLQDGETDVPPGVSMGEMVFAQFMNHKQYKHHKILKGLTKLDEWDPAPRVSDKVTLTGRELLEYKRYLIEIFGENCGERLGSYPQLQQFIVDYNCFTTWWNRGEFTFDDEYDDDLYSDISKVHAKLMYLGTGATVNTIYDDDKDDYEEHIEPITSTEWS